MDGYKNDLSLLKGIKKGNLLRGGHPEIGAAAVEA